MFITENQNVAESILFLLSARESLSYMVENSSISHKEILKNFLMNEASDYEIMYMLMHEEIPSEKYNFVEEIKLFSDLKELVLINFNVLNKYLGENVSTFINEVDTVYPSYSSAAPILEFQLATQNHVLNEFDKEGVGVQKVVDYMKQGNAPADLAKAANKVSSFFGKSIRALVASGNKKAAVLKLTNKGVDPSTANKMFSMQQKVVSKVGKSAYVGKGIDAGAANKMFGLGQKASKITKDVGALKAAGAASLKQGAGVSKAAAHAKDVASLRTAGATSMQQQAGAGTGFLAAIKAKAIAAAPALQKAVTSQAGVAVGGAALAALALYASVKLYKRFMSKAAKSCAGQAGSAKTMCMKKHQHGAIAAQIKDLNGAMNACAKAKKPEKCKIPIQKKISNLQVKMQKMKANMAG